MRVSNDREMFIKNLKLLKLNQIGERGSLMEGACHFIQGCKS